MNKTKNIVLLSTLGALIFIGMWLDRMLSMVLPVSFAIITITVVIAFGLIKDKLYFAVGSGVIFGLSSLLVALMTGNEMFINPLISVLPRVILGFVMFLYYKISCRLIKNEKVGLGVSSFLTSITNTILVLGAMSIFAKFYYTGDALRVLLLANALPEAIASTILSPIIILGVRKAMK